MGYYINKSARITSDAGERRLQSEKTTLSHPLSVHFEGLCKHHHSVVGGSIARPPRRTCERGGRGGAAAAEAAGATEISILSLEMELLFGVTRSRGRGRSVSLVLSRPTTREGLQNQTEDRGKRWIRRARAPDFREIQASLFFLQRASPRLLPPSWQTRSFSRSVLPRPSLSFPSFISA